MKTDNTYLGFDFGTSNVAAGLIVREENTLMHDTYFLKLDPASDPFEIHRRIQMFLYSEFRDHIHENCYSFIESVFSGPNKRTYQRMTRVGHSLNILLREWESNVQYLDNNVWRKILFNKGNIKKEAAQEWAYSKWPTLLEYKKGEQGHRADALMIAEAGRILVETGIERETCRPS